MQVENAFLRFFSESLHISRYLSKAYRKSYRKAYRKF